MDTVSTGKRWTQPERSDGGTCCWPWFRDSFKVYIPDTALGRQVSGWHGCRPHAAYFDAQMHPVGVDVIVPAHLVKRACRLLGLRLPGRITRAVENGERLQAEFPGQGFGVKGLKSAGTG